MKLIELRPISLKCPKCDYEIIWELDNPALKVESGICGPKCDKIWTRLKRIKDTK